MLVLQYLICGSRGFEPVISQRLGARLRNHPRLHCSAYACKTYAEFVELNKLVGKPGKRLWAAVEVLDTDTGRTFDPSPSLLLSLSGGGTARPEKPPVGNTGSPPAVASLESAPPSVLPSPPAPPEGPADLPPVPKPRRARGRPKKNQP